ncbi:MAG: AmmeMemoRadiSam system protein A [Gammaproteobacteria bacterium]|nr:AmmeMemoRadiSam system protein A [Gammaproteobacteria bacterium]
MTKDSPLYNTQQRQLLLQLARDSISCGLQNARPLAINIENFAAELQQHRACFVTLHLHQQLRGCIGSLEAHRPLVLDVSENAYAAAFKDPRFNPLQESEFDQLSLSISVLTPATEMVFDSEQDLINQIQPNVDGLILEEGYHRGTFLPSVWEQLPDPVEFLQHLKLKAGLAADFWSDNIKVSKYQTESFE